MKSKHPYRFSSKSYLLFILFFLFFLDGFALLFATKIDHDRSFKHARVVLEKTAVSLQERMDRVVTATEAILENKASRIEEKGLKATISSRKEWESFRKAAKTLPDSGELWLLDDRANLVMDSTTYPSQRVTFSEREYFALHRDKGVDLYIGPVVKGRIIKKHAFTISKRINGKGGRFLGVVLASIETDAFADFLRRIDLGEGGTVTVFRTDGALVLRQPMEDKYLRKNFKNLKLFTQNFEESPSGIIESDMIDGLPRLIGYSKIMGLPLVVATGIPIDSVLNDWRGRVRIYSLMAIMGFMALVALSLVVRRTTSREEKERTRELAEINESLEAQITERTMAQTALQESEQRWATTLASIGDGIIATDVAGKITFMNAIAEELTQWKNIDAVGRPVADIFRIVDESTRQAVQDPVGKVLNAGTTVGLADQTVLITKDGSRIPIDDSGSPILDDAGKMTGVVLVFRDTTDRRLAERALSDSRQDLNRAQEVAHIGSWRLNLRHGGELLWSDEAYRIFGVAPRTPMTYETFLAIVHPSDRDNLVRRWEDALAGKHYDLTHRIVVDDSVKWVREVAELEFDEDGALLAGFGTVQDVTDQKKMEQALKMAHDELELRVQERTAEIRRQADLLDLAHDAIIVTDTKGRILFWNPGAIATYGFTREDLGVKDHHRLLDTQFPIPLESILAVVESKGRWEGELAQTTQDGRRIVVLSRWAMRQGTADGPPEILEINTDITTRRQTEEALRRASVYNRSLIEASLDPLVTIDLDGIISDVNSATELATGYSRTELIGTDFSGYFTHPERVRTGHRLAIDKGFIRDYPLEMRHKSGHSTSVLYNASLYKDETGKTLGIFAAARDITEKNRLERHLRESHKMEAIGTLAGGIAHDFNNIIAGIIGFTEMVLEDIPEDNPAHRRLGYILKGAHRGRDLVKQILAFSRRSEQEKKVVSLSQIIDEVVSLVRATLPATIEIKTTSSVASDLVLADPTQIHQVVINLCSNAAHAMSARGGVLEISLAAGIISSREHSPHQDLEPGSYVKLTVVDNGDGMEPGILEHIFEPFFTTKSAGEGTGLGLAVVHGIVRNHNGVITASSEPGKGSSFTIYLPRIQTAQADETEKGEAALGGDESILIVDDEELIVEMSIQRLQRFGYQATGVTGSIRALEIFRNDPDAYDLIVTDHLMPDMTGLELAGELLRIKPGIRIIMCSGLHEPVPLDRIRQAGIREFFTKPVDRNEFVRIVRNVLDDKSL
ncbi:MAG: PAS domain S-box protein [Syntrophorhabdaceae bacterium]|nr:PAS domain S-box protein [Syntrophorhabdaceae bacterium]